MKLFFTPSAQHLALKIDSVKEGYISKTFSDGEKYIRVEKGVKGTIWVIANTNPPAENLLELFFLLDALKRQPTEIHLLIPYFAYARQDRIKQKGECLSTKVISDFLQCFKLKKVVVVHMHSKRVERYFDYENVLPLQLVCSLAKQMDIIVAPDEGGVEFATVVGKECGLSVIYMEKKRITDKKVEIIKMSGKVKGKKVMIVDDMIATGGTIIKATEKLMAEGAKGVYVYATHGIFSGNAREQLEKSPIKRIYVTNSLLQKAKGKIKVIDISRLLQEVIKTRVRYKNPHLQYRELG